MSVNQCQWQWGVALGWYEAGLRPEGSVMGATSYQKKGSF
jgi:hypothetical protein